MDNDAGGKSALQRGVRRLRDVAQEAWLTLRHGDWECGCEFYRGKPMLGVFSTWHDGRWIGAHLGPLWVSVHY